MKTRILLVMVLLFSALLTTYAQEEPELAFVGLVDGETITNVFEENVNAHVYVFQGSAGDSVTITMIQEEGSTLDPYLALLGPSGQVYTTNDDGGEVPLSAIIKDFELPEDGTYFVLATTFNGIRKSADEIEGETDEPLTYEITATGITAPEGADAEEGMNYFAAEIEPAQSVTLEISAEEPVFYLTFTASAGDVITIRTTDDQNGDPIDTLLYLFDALGNRLAVNDDNGEDYFSAIIEYTIPEDGMYMIFATAWDFAQAYTGEWSGPGSFILTVE